MPKRDEFLTLSVNTGSIIRTILWIVLFYFLFQIRDILLVVLTAIVLASAIEPGTRWFVSRKIPRVFAVLLIYIATAVVFVSAFYFLLIPLVGESSSFLKSLPEYSATLSQQATVPAEAVSQNFLQGFSQSFSLPALIGVVNTTLVNLSSGFFGTVDVIFGGVLSFFLIVVLSFYLAVQEDGISKFLRIVLPAQREEYAIDLWRRSREKIGLWMQGQLMLSIIMGVLAFLGLTLLGVKSSLLLAFLAAVFEIIPLFGAFLAATPAVVIAYMQGGISMSLIVAGFFLVIQQFESHLIYPVVVKKVVGVPPIISILALVVGAKLGGFLGIILAVPLATIFIEILNDLEKRKANKVAM
jgi:predicted PurR-regulated permease PerM